MSCVLFFHVANCDLISLVSLAAVGMTDIYTLAIQVNPCNETGSGTASLELSSVNHLLGCMVSCGVY